MASLALLVLLVLTGPVWATWDSCRGTCGLRPTAFDLSSLAATSNSSGGDNDTLGSSETTSLGMDGAGVPSGTWPGIVSIQATLENGTWHMCSGALIHPQWVLTVAQCFFASRDISIYSVVIGATDLSQPGPQAQLCRIQRLLLHQSYVAATGRNNIALLQLEQPVECSDYIQLGCVPDSSLAVPELKTCYLAGWRAAPAGAPSPRLVLQEAKVQLIDAQLCNSSRWYGGAVHPQDLCAGYPRGGIDTCQGDSGGPLVCKDNAEDNFWLVGLASWGRGCTRARRPGIFTSTQHFHAWIRAHAGPSPAAPTPEPEPTLGTREPPGAEPEPARAVSIPKQQLTAFLAKLQEMLELLKNRTG